MKIAATIANTLTRLTGVIQIVLGILFWTGNALGLIPIHILSGTVLVLSLWTLAILAARAGVQPGLVALALIWGLITVALGLTQDRIMVNSAHWIIQVVHLLVGIGAVGQAEALAARIKRAHLPEKTASDQSNQNRQTG